PAPRPADHRGGGEVERVRQATGDLRAGDGDAGGQYPALDQLPYRFPGAGFENLNFSAGVRFTCPTDCPIRTLPSGTFAPCGHRSKMMPSVCATRSATFLASSGGRSSTCTRPVAISWAWSCQFLFHSARGMAFVRVTVLATMYSICT